MIVFSNHITIRNYPINKVPDGYSTLAGFDAAEDHIGPFYFRKFGESYHCVFEVAAQHCNASGIVHGGVLMTFADFALCLEATDNYAEESCVTVSFNCEFVAAADAPLMECRSEITRKTGSMVFLTGKIFAGDQVVLTFSAITKRLRSKLV